ncbi:hypothetical protein D3C72_2187490 [compost metagenome]
MFEKLADGVEPQCAELLGFLRPDPADGLYGNRMQSGSHLCRDHKHADGSSADVGPNDRTDCRICHMDHLKMLMNQRT